MGDTASLQYRIEQLRENVRQVGEEYRSIPVGEPGREAGYAALSSVLEELRGELSKLTLYPVGGSGSV